MLFYLETNTSSPSMLQISLASQFYLLSSSIECFKPGLTYVRCQPIIVPNETTPTPDCTASPSMIYKSISSSRSIWIFIHFIGSYMILYISVPHCCSQAIKHKCCQQAMKEKPKPLEENRIWDTVTCPSGAEPIGGNKWVYTVILQSDSTLDCYKARLVALHNRQEYGVNYNNFCSSGQNDYSQNFNCYCCTSGLTTSSNGSQECFLAWWSHSLHVSLFILRFHFSSVQTEK